MGLDDWLTDSPVGRGDLNDDLDGLVVEVPAVTADEQRALGHVRARRLERVERRLDEVMQVRVLQGDKKYTEKRGWLSQGRDGKRVCFGLLLFTSTAIKRRPVVST